MSEPRDTAPDDRTLAEAMTRADVNALGPWLRAQRWSGVRTRSLESLGVLEAVPLERGTDPVLLAVIEAVPQGEAGAWQYAVPLRTQVEGDASSAVLAVPREGAASVSFGDATDDPRLPTALLSLIASRGSALGCMGGQLEAVPTAAFHPVTHGADLSSVRRLKGEQSNTSYVLGERVVLKLLRRLHAGIHPDVEVTGFLTRRGFPNAPKLLGTVTLKAHTHALQETVIAVVQQFVPSRGDAWSTTLGALRTWLERPDRGSMPTDAAERLGAVTGAMHVALASDRDDPAFAPEPWRREDSERFRTALHARIDQLAALPPETGVSELVARVETMKPSLDRWIETLASCERIRVHGDYHLGQVLDTGGDFMVLDFEGEPLRPLEERRAKSPALRDVAGMLRSYDYAAAVIAREGSADDATRAHLDSWLAKTRTAFLHGYMNAVRTAPKGVLPGSRDDGEGALALFEIDKALYEVAYEAGHRPDWVEIPVQGALRALDRLRG